MNEDIIQSVTRAQRGFEFFASAQRIQLNARGYTSFDVMWNDVTGYTTTPPPPHIDPTNMAFAQTAIARYLTRSNPKLSPEVTYNLSLIHI